MSGSAQRHRGPQRPGLPHNLGATFSWLFPLLFYLCVGCALTFMPNLATLVALVVAFAVVLAVPIARDYAVGILRKFVIVAKRVARQDLEERRGGGAPPSAEPGGGAAGPGGGAAPRPRPSPYAPPPTPWPPLGPPLPPPAPDP